MVSRSARICTALHHTALLTLGRIGTGVCVKPLFLCSIRPVTTVCTTTRSSTFTNTTTSSLRFRLQTAAIFSISKCGHVSVAYCQPLKLAGIIMMQTRTAREPINILTRSFSEGLIKAPCKQNTLAPKSKRAWPRNVETTATCGASGRASEGPNSSFQPKDAINVEEKLKEWESMVNEKNLPVAQRSIHHCHQKAVKNGREVYEDPVTGFEVFTILSHLRRGYCCGNACRHCPYKHVNVSSKYRDLKVFNSAFYV